jgi:leucyl aminopeptidase
MKIAFNKLELPDSGNIVLLVAEDVELSGMAKELDAAAGGQLARAMQTYEFTGKKKQSVNLVAPGGTGLAQVVVAGLGNLEEYTPNDWINLGGAICGHIKGKLSEVTIIAETGSADELSLLAFGAMLRSYKFDKYKTDKKADKKTKRLKAITIACADPEAVSKAYKDVEAVSAGVFTARNLVNEPANVLGTREFVKKIKKLEKIGLEVKILNEKEMKKLRMNALLAVGHGSTQPSRLAIMRWNGKKDGDGGPVAFVGKGVCFDSGGISIKPSANMDEMKGDMGGAACVTGLMQALAGRRAPVNAIGVVGLVENMPSGTAQRPGDVVTSMSGQTIEVMNTDAEGRMVLADALWYTQDVYKPRIMINLATLTGAILVALEKQYAGLFSNNDELADKISATGLKTGEKVWRMPMGKEYDKMIDSKIADMKNTGSKGAGSITAAQFLQRFVNDTPWAHIDIAGTAMGSPKTDTNDGWASGFGVRLLDQLVRDHYEQ